MLNIPDEIKQLLKNDNTRKNFRVHFPNGERADITNENIVEESVSLTESICSEEKFKFGLCESPVLEFETFGVGKIKGYTIEASLEIYCPETVEGAVYRQDLNAYVYPVPYGVFVVDSCKKQADMNYRRIIAYSDAVFELPDSYLSTLKSIYQAGGAVSSINGFDVRNLPYIMHPEINEFEDGPEASSRDVITHVITETENGHTYSLYIEYFKYERFSVDRFEGSTAVINEIHTIDYVRDMKTIYDFLKNDGAVKFIEKVKSNDLGANFFKYEYYPESTSDYYVLDADVSFRNILDVKENNYYVVEAGSRYYQYHQIDEDYRVPYTVALSKDGETVEVAQDTSRRDIKIQYAIMPYRHADSDAYLYALRFGSSKITIKSEVSAKTKKFYIPNVDELASYDFRSAYASYCELTGKIGIVDRNGVFNTVSVSDMFEHPADVLLRKDYQTLWYDDDYSLPIGRLICTYKNSGGVSKFVERIIDENYSRTTHRTYSITFNYFIQNNSYEDSQINEILAKMAKEIKSNISYMPMELAMIGRPDLEAGDVVILETDEGQIVGFIEKRELSGINNLIDSMTSKDETESSSNTGLKSDYDEETEILTIYS